jgi:hypothetical protein
MMLAYLLDLFLLGFLISSKNGFDFSEEVRELHVGMQLISS